MQKKSKKSADLEIERSEKRKSPGGLSIKEGRHIFQELDAYLDAQAEERCRIPPKTDYVLPCGKMLPVPSNLLASEKDVLGMYKHLHWFCGNSVTHSTDHIYRDHDHPIDCLTYMYEYGCISLGELRAILQMPLQIRLLHEYFYQLGFLNIYPYRRFVVEFVEMLRFMLRLNGYVEAFRQPVRRYCYSWYLMIDHRLPESAFRSDKLAKSYENETLSSKAFIKQWGELRAMVPVKKWMYCKYESWFLAFNENHNVDFGLTESAPHGWAAAMENRRRDQQEDSDTKDMVSALKDFCEEWALTHLGTPMSEDIEGGDVMIKAERVDVIPRGYVVRPVSGDSSASGFNVYMPKYCGFSAISRYRDQDFEQLKYALKYGHKHRRRTSGMPLGQMKKLLRLVERVLKQNGAPQESIYCILKVLANQHRQASDTTMHGYGFYPPKNLASNGEIRQMPSDKAYALAMQYTAENRELQKTCQEILRRFGLDVDIHQHGMAVNMA